MSSISSLNPLPAVAGVRGESRYFFVAMAAICVLIAYGGFIPTYWSKLASGSFKGAPVLHLHGMLFFAWTLFFFAQTWLVASGRVLSHRNWGLAGISLATAMAISVVLGAINSIKVANGIGMGDEARRFTIVSLSGVVLFAGFIGVAIANIRNKDLHKRLMLLAMIPLMHAAMARVFMTAFAPAGAKGPPPVFVALPPGLFVDLLIVAAIIYDWRSRGRPHPAYLLGGGLILVTQLLAIPISGTAAWMGIAKSVEALAG
jgi:hypothetical protein